jgi:hypothetical protein
MATPDELPLRLQDSNMPAYAVLEPPRRDRSASEHTDRFVFWREKFSFGAFLFGPLWMLWRRLWIVLIIYLVVVGFITYGLQRVGIGWSACAAVFGLIQFLVGLEATSLRRWTRLRRGWRDCGVVIADDREMAERRFFDAKAVRPPIVSPVEAPVMSPLMAATLQSTRPDVTGLFPEPGGGR